MSATPNAAADPPSDEREESDVGAGGRTTARVARLATLAAGAAALPALVACGVEWLHAADRRAPTSDLALLAAATHGAAQFEQWHGAYSRHGFAHPGPFAFYLLAPVQSLFGSAVAPHLFAGVLFAVVLFAAARELGGGARDTAKAWGVALVLAGTCATLSRVHFFGSIFAHAWNPSMALAGLFGLAAASAALLRGYAPAAPWGALAFALAAQSHATAAPMAVALALPALPACRRMLAEPGTRRYVSGAAALLVLSFIPVALDAALHRGGNLRDLLAYLFARNEPAKSWLDERRVFTMLAAPVLGIFDAWGATFLVPGSRSGARLALGVTTLASLAGVVAVLRGDPRRVDPLARSVAKLALSALLAAMVIAAVCRGRQPFHVFYPIAVAGTLVVVAVALPWASRLATRRGLVTFGLLVACTPVAGRASALVVERRLAILDDWPTLADRVRVANVAACLAEAGPLAIRLQGKSAWIPGATAALAALESGRRPVLDPVERGVFGDPFEYAAPLGVPEGSILVVSTRPLDLRITRRTRPSITLHLAHDAPDAASHPGARQRAEACLRSEAPHE